MKAGEIYWSTGVEGDEGISLIPKDNLKFYPDSKLYELEVRRKILVTVEITETTIQDKS